MTRINAFLLGALIAFIAIIGSNLAQAATQPSPRYTAREVVKIHNHHCTEDEYMFVPARFVNPRVIYDTPDRAFCVAIENIRLAPQN